MRYSLIFKEVWHGISKNISMVISVILVTFVSLTFVGIAGVMQLQINQMKSFWYDRAQVAIYQCTAIDSSNNNCQLGKTTDEQQGYIEQLLKSDTVSPFVEKYYFEDQRQAFDNFKKQFAGNPILEFTSEDQMPETYWVKLKESSDSEVLKEIFGSVPGVQSVVDQRSLLDQIFSVLNIASYTAIAVAALMLVAAVLLISTTIRLSAISRRREISIMRLVGASNRFIQIPFIIEGMIAALIGAVLASLATLAIVEFFIQGNLAASLPTIVYISTPQVLVLVPFLLGVGAVLSGVAAKVAISRYLKI